jgi:sugar phosphate isomerase/epimerase
VVRLYFITLALVLVSVKTPAKDEVIHSAFTRDNLVAWCIVPFDSKQRTPSKRAEMVARLGLSKVAYDWRNQHVASFEEEILQYKKHGIEFFAFWGWHDTMESLIPKHGIQPQVWSTLGSPKADTQNQRVIAAAKSMVPLAEKTGLLGLKLGLYNHGGWGGEPENLAAVCNELKRQGHNHTGIVYNFHHGHGHIKDFAKSLSIMKPHLLCLNLNGMSGPSNFRKILPIGQGQHEKSMMQAIINTHYKGPIGILGHVSNRDVEIVLKENLQGLEKLSKELRQ